MINVFQQSKQNNYKSVHSTSNAIKEYDEIAITTPVDKNVRLFSIQIFVG